MNTETRLVVATGERAWWGGKMGEGNEVQASSYKTKKSWGCNIVNNVFITLSRDRR